MAGAGAATFKLTDPLSLSVQMAATIRVDGDFCEPQGWNLTRVEVEGDVVTPLNDSDGGSPRAQVYVGGPNQALFSQ